MDTIVLKAPEVLGLSYLPCGSILGVEDQIQGLFWPQAPTAWYLAMLMVEPSEKVLLKPLQYEALKCGYYLPSTSVPSPGC